MNVFNESAPAMTARGASVQKLGGLRSNDTTTHLFDCHPVRVALLDGLPWFVAADVCAALGIQWKGSGDSGTLSALDSDEKALAEVSTVGGLQSVAIVSESGMYTLTLRSRGATKPGSKAHRFRRWVTGEVLPALRSTGSYSIGAPPSQFAIPQTLAGALRLAADQAERIEAQAGKITRQVAVIEHQQSAIGEAKHAVMFVQNFINTDGLRGLQNTGLELGLGPNKFVARLKSDGFLHYRGRSLVPKAEYTQRGIFEVREHAGGSGDGRLQTYVTAKGLEFFAHRYAAEIAAAKGAKP